MASQSPVQYAEDTLGVHAVYDRALDEMEQYEMTREKITAYEQSGRNSEEEAAEYERLLDLLTALEIRIALSTARLHELGGLLYFYGAAKFASVQPSPTQPPETSND
jgi:hypothetical protein